MAGTTVPSVRRRYRDKAELAGAVIDSLRVEPLPTLAGPPRHQVEAILENFGRNLRRGHSMALLGTLLAEESRTPELLARFRSRLVKQRRAALGAALEEATAARELPAQTDLDLTVNMLVGSFYARYVSHGRIRETGHGDWSSSYGVRPAESALCQLVEV